MIPILLSIAHKKILIVGGGQVALRKTKQWLKEEAHITIMSPTLHPDFQGLNIHYIHQAFQPDLLDGYFFVYAATDDPHINHEVINEANRKQMLCGSATRDQDVSFYSMTVRENEDFTLALSSKARFPYLKPVAEDLMDQLQTKHEHMSRLYALRPRLLKHISQKQSYFQLLYQAPINLLDQLSQVLDQSCGHLYIYHQNDPTLMEDLDIANLQAPHLVLSLAMLEQFAPLFHLDHIHWTIHPLVLYDGFIHQRIIKLTQFPMVTHLPALISDDEILNHVISLYRSDSRKRCFIIHQRTNSSLKSKFESLLNTNEKLITLQDSLSDLSDHTTLIPFLVTKGNHYADIKKDVQTLTSQGLDIRLEQTLLARKDVQYALLTNQVHQLLQPTP